MWDRPGWQSRAAQFVPATACVPLPARPDTFLTHCAIDSPGKNKSNRNRGHAAAGWCEALVVPGFASNRSDSAGVGFKAPGKARARGLGTKASTGSGLITARVVGFKAPGPARVRRSE